MAWAMLAHLGAGLKVVGLCMDETVFQDMDPQITAWGEFVKKEAYQGLVSAAPLDPPFTPDEMEKLQKIRTNVSTLVEQNMDKFIMGDRPLGDYDNFVKELNAAGAQGIEKIYNDAYGSVKTKK